MVNKRLPLIALLFGYGLASACSSDPEPAASATVPAPQQPAAARPAAAPTAAVAETDIPRNAYFGDSHVHTGWSADAGMDGAVTSPADAYRLARGEEVRSNTGQMARLGRPYDWFTVTDHSDAMGTINELIEGNPEMMADEILARWREALNSGDEERAAAAKSELIVMQSNEQLPAIFTDPKWMVSAWEQTVQAAEDFYEPGRFTTFAAFEWTVNAGGGDNLHRNVIFRDTPDRTLQILPLTTFQTQDPADLWAWMEDYERTTGGRVLAIPHNGNMSNGRMFEERQFAGGPMTRGWAEMRVRFERLYEVSQIKGQSESHPTLSPSDEFADWDIWDRGNLILSPKPEGALQFEYWREALQSGLRIESELGVNPFLYGANGATDTHTGLSTTEEDNFFGKFKTLEPRAERWSFPLLTGPTGNISGWEQAAAAVMGVWATANTREAIWDAMYRRETFATTGPRMRVRFFAGFGLTDADLEGDLPANGYARGVPMGGQLTAAPGGQAPAFLIEALKDPDGANLDRVQIVKGWLDANGETQEVIYDVAWSDERQRAADGSLPEVGNTVNLETAEYDNSIGATRLSAVFRDPDFDPDLRAVYYVRVLEIPTPRWTLYDKVRFDVEMAAEVPLVHQERAFTSPIWYSP